MKLNRIAIGTGVLVALALAALLINRAFDGTGSRGETRSLVEGVDFSRGKTLRISQDKAQVTLKASPDGWVVAEQGDFPADQAKLRKLVFQLSSALIEHKVTERKEKLGELGLLTMVENGGKFEKDVTGIELVVEAGDGKALFKLIVGKSRATGAGYGGQYVRPGGETVAYLIPEALQLETEPQGWLESNVFAMDDKKDLQRMTLRRPKGGALKFSRADEKAPWRLEGMPEGQLDARKVDAMARDIAALSVNSLAAPEMKEKELGRERVTTVELTLFDKRTYRITVGEEKTGEDLRHITVQGGLPADVSDAELKNGVEDFNKRFNNRVLAVFDWEGDVMLKTVKDFRKGENKKP